ncbi:hypothetical protein NBRC111894_4406 [Sporolactobacillus inulinus]|uniref:Uncharacterized protein n=1 Tax=Sporolactobacillus inulinus TaxID=2078 RepID=A0A4Y1ZI41_9BACL|nr:hypothetical protein NBRC111894_4406 [Sporolactobacillus inulinus]
MHSLLSVTDAAFDEQYAPYCVIVTQKLPLFVFNQRSCSRPIHFLANAMEARIISFRMSQLMSASLFT